MLETVRLKNGAEEHTGLVSVTMAHLNLLMDSEPIAFYELVMLARDHRHKLFGSTNEPLESLGLVKRDGRGGWTMHDSLRNTILSAVSGEGMKLVLDSPIATGNVNAK